MIPQIVLIIAMGLGFVLGFLCAVAMCWNAIRENGELRRAIFDIVSSFPQRQIMLPHIARAKKLIRWSNPI